MCAVDRHQSRSACTLGALAVRDVPDAEDREWEAIDKSVPSTQWTF